MEYRIGICDDEMSTCSWLEMAIHDYMRWHNYKCQIYVWDSSDTFIKELKNKVDIDILFLDIRMPGIDGIEAGVYIREHIKDKYMNIIYIRGWLMIDNTGAYYIVPDSIDLEYNHDGYFETQYLHIFEDEDLLKLVNNIVINNYGNREVVIEITDYKKEGNTITFKLCKNRNYYYPCSFTIGDDNLDITGGEFFYASSLNPGVIGIDYEQNGQNYPVKVDELGNAFVNVPWSGSTYNNATQTSDGLMSKEDKTKLDGFTGSITNKLAEIVSSSEKWGEYNKEKLTNKDENTVYFIKG